MGLLQKACETYDSFPQKVGKYIEGEEPLAPCSHTVTRADLEITVNQYGSFVSAAAVDKNSPKFIMPVTEKSAGRTNSICAHPLCDQLKYLAPYDDKRYSAYLEQLQEWESSEYSHPMLGPILRYIRSGTILSDLQEAALIKLNEKGLPEKDKQLVRWRVVGLDEEDSGACWENEALFRAFDAFYQKKKEAVEPVLCMVTGGMSSPAEQHMKGVVALNGNAKLISDNDDKNFTYRGRFANSSQAETVGYVASQKAHNALRWLVANQGTFLGGRTFLCWSPQGVRLPKPQSPFLLNGESTPPATPSDYQEQLRQTLKGWQTSLPTEQTEAVIAAFDAATSGRLSLTYYNELRASDFLERLYRWDRLCCWPNGKFGIQSPSLKQIVDCAFGTQRGDGNSSRLETDDKVLRQQMQRLLSCRIDMARMPADIVKLLTQRASTPQAYERRSYEKILFTACAVIRKYHYDIKEEECSMALEPQKMDRSYQYGRLLAVLEKAERDTYGSGEGREPNAVRLQSVFAQRPQYTARIIWEQVKKAYFPRLCPSARSYYDKLLGEIIGVLSMFPEAELNRPLGDAYLMGYYLQRSDLYTKKEKNTEENENGDSEE